MTSSRKTRQYKLPESVKIGGAAWSIENIEHVISADQERVSGICDPSWKLIRVSTDEDNVDVFLHELGHSLAYLIGRYDESMSSEGERIIEQLSHATRAFLADNADEVIRLCRWLKRG